MNASHRILVLAGALLMFTSAARAQVTTNEIEPNSVKTEATPVLGMVAGDMITGTTTGTTATAGSTVAASADTFLVQTAALPLGIYRHRLVITTSGTAGHTGRILGVSQSAGVPTTTSITFQSSATTTTPARMVQWYGFGKQEQIYIQIVGTSTTTSPYVMTLFTDPVEPVVVQGCFSPGTLTLQTVGLTTVDTDTTVFDGNLDPIPGYSNDDEPAGGTGTLQSKLVRTYAAGTYYYALARFETGTNLGSPPDDSFQSGALVDFPGLIVNSQSESTTNTNLTFSISDGVNTKIVPCTKVISYEIVFAKFTVSATTCAPDSGSQFCFGDNGCPCSNNSGISAGQGCAHGTAGGANLASTGVASVSADTLVLNATNLPFPPGGQGSILFFQGTTQVNVPFNDGKRCVAGNMVRLGIKLHGNFTTFASYPGAGDPSISIKGMNTAGATRHYQGQYRTVPGTGCMTNSNTTNGLTLVWVP